MSKSSLYNRRDSNNKNENNELISNKYILDPNNIKELYNSNNVNNNKINNNNHKYSKNNNNEIYNTNDKKKSKYSNEYSIAPSPVLSLTTISSTKNNIESKNDLYKLSPSVSNSSLSETNLSTTNNSMTKPSLITTINQIDLKSIYLTSPILSSENLQVLPLVNTKKPNSLVSKETTKLNNEEINIKKSINSNEIFQFPYTPSSSLSFIPSYSELELNKMESVKKNSDDNIYVNFKENESSLNTDSKELTNRPTKLLENICNMDIYKPSTISQLNDYSIKNDDINEKEKLEKLKCIKEENDSSSNSIDTSINYSALPSSFDSNNLNNLNKIELINEETNISKRDNIIKCIAKTNTNTSTITINNEMATNNIFSSENNKRDGIHDNNNDVKNNNNEILTEINKEINMKTKMIINKNTINDNNTKEVSLMDIDEKEFKKEFNLSLENNKLNISQMLEEKLNDLLPIIKTENLTMSLNEETKHDNNSGDVKEIKKEINENKEINRNENNVNSKITNDDKSIDIKTKSFKEEDESEVLLGKKLKFYLKNKK